MKNKGIWIILGIIVIGAIVYYVWVTNKNKKGTGGGENCKSVPCTNDSAKNCKGFFNGTLTDGSMYSQSVYSDLSGVHNNDGDVLSQISDCRCCK